MIDIVIPGYNCHSTLHECLERISQQDCVDRLHVVFVDDCSSDNYDDILSQFKNKIDLKYIRSEKNSGPGFCRQLGIDNSVSDYITFVDSDDLILGNDSLSAMLKVINEGYDCVSSLVYNEYFDICLLSVGDLHGKMYRRSFLDKHDIRFQNERYHEDNLFNSLVSLNKARTTHLDVVSYGYFDNKGSLTYKGLSDFSAYFGSYIKLLAYVFNLYRDKKIGENEFETFLAEKKKYFYDVYNNSSDERRAKIDAMLKRCDIYDIIH